MLRAIVASCLLLAGCASLSAPEDEQATTASCPEARDRLLGIVLDTEGHHVSSSASLQVRDPQVAWWDASVALEEDGTFSSPCYPKRVHEVGLRTSDGAVPWTRVVPGIPARLAFLRGSVLDVEVFDADGRPAAAQVYVHPADKTTAESVSGLYDTQNSVPATGKGRFESVPPGRYEVTADVHVSKGNTMGAEATVEVRSGERARVELRARRLPKPTGLVSGRVVDPLGRPVAGARVVGRSDTVVRLTRLYQCGSVAGARAKVVSDANGEFVLSELSSEPWHLAAHHDGWESSPEVRTELPAKELVLTLREPARLVGRVLGADGKPLTSFAVDERPLQSADGTFDVRWERTWESDVTITADGHLRAKVPAKSSTGASIDLGDVRLARAQQLCGRILTADGKPLVGASVEVEGKGPYDPLARAPDLPTEEYCIGHEGRGTLAVYHRDFGIQRTAIPPGVARRDLVLLPPGAIEVQVLDGLGRPSEGASVAVEDTFGNREACEISSEGTCHTTRLAPGRYTVSLLRPRGPKPEPRTVGLEPGATASVELRLPKSEGFPLVFELEYAKHRFSGVAALRAGVHRAPSSKEERDRFLESAQESFLEPDARAWAFQVPAGQYTLLLQARVKGEEYHRARPQRWLVHVMTVEVRGPTRVAVRFPDDAPFVGAELEEPE